LAALFAGEHFNFMKRTSWLAGLGHYSAVGFQMVAVTLIFAAIGWWLDQRTGWGPTFLVIFFFLGSGGGFLVVYRAVQNDSEKKP
jgi:F0F1-type ATP synthase assembly protein I